MTEAITSALVAAAVALATSLVSFRREQRRFQREFDLDREKLRTGFMAEQVARQLLEVREKKRTFKAIKRRLGGFSGDELRQILVKAGAVRFEKRNGPDLDEETAELWGLLSRNKDDF